MAQQLNSLTTIPEDLSTSHGAGHNCPTLASDNLTHIKDKNNNKNPSPFSDASLKNTVLILLYSMGAV